MKNKSAYLFLLFFLFQQTILAQDINVLLANMKSKMGKIKDYEAEGEMKTKVIFLKLPIASVKLYYKNPNKFKLKSAKGVSFIPKGAVSFNMNSLLNDHSFTVIDAGSDNINNIKVRVVKLLPNEDNSDLVLSTLYIDPVNLLIIKNKTTTKENGTYELMMKYGKYSSYGLPDEILFSFNTRDYKLPKGITFDFDDQAAKKPTAKNDKPSKGEVKISLNKYSINKNLSDEFFK